MPLSVVGPSTPQFHERLWDSPSSLLFSLAASLNTAKFVPLPS
jgi:hypothetical protein